MISDVWAAMHSNIVVFTVPFLILFSLLSLCGFHALRHELPLRGGRHRGVYKPVPRWRAKVEGGIAGSHPKPVNGEMISLGEYVWNTPVFGMIGDADTDPGFATITFAPDGGLANLPLLLGPPPPDDEFERKVESLIQRHERLYHPLAA